MVTEESILRDFARLFVWYPLRWIITIVPMPNAFPIFRFLGRIHYSLGRRKRKIIINNMNSLSRRIRNHLKNKDITRKYFETHYVNQLIIFLFPRLNKGNICSFHKFKGLERIEEEIGNGNGCILLHAHFGPVHLPLFHLGIKGYPVKQLGFLRKPEGLSRIGERISYRLRIRYEKEIPAKIIQADQFLREAYQHLRNNGLLMVTGDGAGRGEFIGKFMPFTFLGKEMLFPTGPAKLAMKTGSSIIPMFTIREKESNRYITVVENPILYGSSNKTAEVTKIMGEFIHIFEYYITNYPDHWHFWDEFSKGNLIVG